jgi:hypothetical protein
MSQEISPVVDEPTKDVVMSPEMFDKAFRSALLDGLHYISHPSTSKVECTINFASLLRNEPQNYKVAILKTVASKILAIDDTIDGSQITLSFQNVSFTFREDAALKIMNVVLKDKVYHALYPIFTKWSTMRNITESVEKLKIKVL